MPHLCFSLSNRRTCETAFLIYKQQKYVSLRYFENNQAFEAGQKLTETTWNSPFTAAVFSVFGSAFDFCREICNRQHKKKQVTLNFLTCNYEIKRLTSDDCQEVESGCKQDTIVTKTITN